MGETVNSICFQENNISWIQVEVNSGHRVVIKKVVESPLPLVINYDNIQKQTTALQIANHLKSLASSSELNFHNTRFLLSAKFALIKKVQVDQHIPQPEYSRVVESELSQSFTGDADDYFVYQPEYLRETDSLKDLLAVAIRKDLFSFLKRIGKEANIPVSQINLNCFAIDELYRRFFPDLRGQTLLTNFTERGFETVISDETNFLNFSFKPYSKSLQNIDQLDEKEVLSVFTAMVEDLQHPATIDLPLYSISRVFLFGSYFKPHWMDSLKEQLETPIQILDPTGSPEWQIIVDDESFNSSGPYRFVEPLSNIF